MTIHYYGGLTCPWPDQASQIHLSWTQISSAVAWAELACCCSFDSAGFACLLPLEIKLFKLQVTGGAA